MSYSLDFVELHLFGVFRFVPELLEHMLVLAESVLLLYFVPLIFGVFLLDLLVHHTPSVFSWMFFITVGTFEVIIFNFPGTLIS